MKMLFVVLFLWSCGAFGQSVRLKDILRVKGNRSNNLMGVGLVVGLAGTGDSPASLSTNKALSSLLSRMGLGKFEQNVTQAVAVVVVNASMPAFSRNGHQIDVNVSTLGDAVSLAGGRLLSSRLKAGDGNVYAIAEGAVVVSQADGVGARTLTSLSIPNGATVEREFVPDLVQNNQIHLLLDVPDFTTSKRVSESINGYFKGFYAKPMDPLTIEVSLPPLFVGRELEFIAEAESLTVVRDTPATVVLNERTGTVVMGANVTIQPVVITHGDLTIQVGEGDKARNDNVVPINGGSISELMDSLNALGLKPQDLIGIVQGISSAGALNANLRIM